MFLDMPIELPDIKQKDVQEVPPTPTLGKSAQSLFNLPNHDIERFSVEVNDSPHRGGVQRLPVEVNNHHPSFPGGMREHNLPCQFGNSGIETSSVELEVLSPRIRVLKTPLESGQHSNNLPSNRLERYSLEVHPPTVS